MNYKDSITLIKGGGTRKGVKQPDVLLNGYFLKKYSTGVVAYTLSKEALVGSAVFYCKLSDIFLVNNKAI